MRPCQHCRAPVSNDVLLCEDCTAKGIDERSPPSASELPSSDPPSRTENLLTETIGTLVGEFMIPVLMVLVGLIVFAMMGYAGATAIYVILVVVIIAAVIAFASS